MCNQATTSRNATTHSIAAMRVAWRAATQKRAGISAVSPISLAGDCAPQRSSLADSRPLRPEGFLYAIARDLGAHLRVSCARQWPGPTAPLDAVTRFGLRIRKPRRRRVAARPPSVQSMSAGHFTTGRFTGAPWYMSVIEIFMSRVPTVTAAASKEGALKKPVALLLKP